MEAGAAENRAMLNGMNFSNLGTRAADHAGITPVQMQAADDPDPTVYKAALVELLVAADRASAEKKMVIELTRRKGDIATAQQMDHHHNADYKERRAYKDMMKSARAEFLAKWVPGVGNLWDKLASQRRARACRQTSLRRRSSTGSESGAGGSLRVRAGRPRTTRSDAS